MDEKNLKKAFEILNPTKEQEGKIFKFIISERENKHRLFRRFVPAIIGLIIIISITTYAINYSHQEFSNKVYQWSMSEEANDINISTSSGGYTITASSIYGDSHNVYIVYTLSRDDGKKLKVREEEGRTSFGFGEIKGYTGEDPSESISTGSSFYALYDDNPDDNEVQFLIKYKNIHWPIGNKEKFGSLEGKDLHVKFGKISIGFMDLFNEGSWELTIPLNYKNMGREYNINQEFSYNGGIARLDAIYYSPLDIIIYLSSNDGCLKDFSLQSFEGDEYLKIKLSDGSYIIKGEGGAGAENKGMGAYEHISLLENGPIKPEDISSIIIGDVEISVSLED
ncbi:MAG TPA: DUF4179 domain-containing protein [Tissierellaceae bacterium]|nr:DUF4179 domain-containing protein [Tissierellaceae bacterium]